MQRACQTSKTRERVRLEIRTERLARQGAGSASEMQSCVLTHAARAAAKQLKPLVPRAARAKGSG